MAKQNSVEQKRFGFTAQAKGVTAQANSFSAGAGGTSSATRLKAPNSSRGPAAVGTGADSTTSADRVNQYQSKLSSMREKFQQRKTLGGPTPTASGQKSQSMSGTNQQSANSSKNFNQSFSAVNSSLQQKWQVAQNKQGTARDTSSGAAGAQQMSSTLVPASPGQNRFSTEVQKQASNALSTSSSNIRG